MTQPAYRDIRQQDVEVVKETDATVRVLWAFLRANPGSERGICEGSVSSC
jgi:hypothetical protein